ncbi:MAG: metalloregulator ArsR/SmtB family transcription factor [bacterium]|nr:metalloregulator ArsR/SmtB family transcription factor [bacterium]
MTEKELERILKALANKRRLAILRVIKNKKEASVADIARQIKLSFTSTSKHLGILASANILEKDQRNVQVFYFFAENMPTNVRSTIALL